MFTDRKKLCLGMMIFRSLPYLIYMIFGTFDPIGHERDFEFRIDDLCVETFRNLGIGRKSCMRQM